MTGDDRMSERTRLLHMGRPPKGSKRPVNPPVVRASTVLYENTTDMRETRRRRAEGERVFAYGTGGTPTTHALEDVVTSLEGGYRTRLVPSGMTAIALAMQAYARPGDHVLITDAVYEPVRRLTKVFFEPFGIAYEYFAADGRDLEGRIRPNTRVVLAEVPGSLAFEMCDLRQIARLTKPRGITLAVDNTWACGYLFKPLQHGADCSILAATKHIVGHADVLLGTVTTTKEAWKPVDDMASAFGYCISPDDAYLALRGVRTMPTRLPVHENNARELCAWLKTRPEVATVFYPPLPEHPGHEIWKRDFTGGCGLFSVEFKAPQDKVDAFVDALELFGLGASWGGYESLVIPTSIAGVRTVTDWSKRGPIVRFHAGLEDPGDLIADLKRAIEKLA